MIIFLNICFSLMLIASFAYSVYAFIKTDRELDKNYWSYNDKELNRMALRIVFCVIRMSIFLLLIILNLFGAIRIAAA